ncbi:tRNA uridine-5-carboxymethylaminomethyl(34) synthesis GTPase MnmE [Treponema phagedenis]|uniref:tRNA modification GTPase MnmE n=1 Tax=Treponema phagedenis TaxID=162 RepID=A0A0B7GVC4_TREPH|nr:tRNA uridine-5-carboxymethylaminomethyl(34) synthesis GTPase MnmE [Treponema phagedenis]EFW37293.1 tRNA modification GTPase TrmE [Treponema phagedenis F0421]NVP23383.1 tRNA uridine-5-carboxymethylaminomethyl(34) synthesis GTPase MnmE [Treponema phagedenis]QEJ95603.1 tRNA uridine-5-carboxymethylaminomethyl(34) synthesis GTPase MnmE [Treponema phagedenis]QEJ98525.1 tRNA uridine-5-carboxymethylaminomethyl(34) synthesis GTPase MnmE [Treponema phagedenis]QEK01456.1 tRNA uridine-5-carboxymethylam
MNPSEYALDDDIAAIATALAPAALGIVRTSGKTCIERVSRFFSRPAALQKAPGNSIVYGWIIDAGKKLDEVVALVYRAPKSFTGENCIEIICHGGVQTVKSLYRLCLDSGFRAAEKGEFSFRSFINGKTDLTGAEAIAEIIGAKTLQAQTLAAGRLSGNLFAELQAIKEKLLTALAAIEVEIEYPEDEETIADAFDTALLEEPLTRLQELEASRAGEKIFQEGVRIVLAGKTNSGKSSLFNALLKEDRAIVSDIHGTTRDWLETDIDFSGIPVKLFDTAGIRETSDTIEAIGVQRSLDLLAEADAVFYLADGRTKLSPEDKDFIVQNTKPLIVVRSRAALMTDGEKDYALKEMRALSAQAKKEFSCICIDSKTMEGVGALVQTTAALITEGKPATSDISLGTERQKIAVQQAAAAAKHALHAARQGFPLDAIVQDIEESLAFLGEITGEVRSDDILDKIFSGFCVGK